MSVDLDNPNVNQPDDAPQLEQAAFLTGSLPGATVWGIAGGAAAVSVVANLALSGFDFTKLNPFGVLAIGALLYLVVIYFTSRSVEGPRFAVDRVVTGVVSTFFLAALLPLISVIVTVLQRGLPGMDANFFTKTLETFVLDDIGGAQHAIIGTLIVTAVATIVSVPIGVLAAIYLVEYGNNGRLSRALTFFVDVMTGIPSIVAGLFGLALFTIFIGPEHRSAMSGGIALSVIMIPIVVRSTEEMLKLVPRELRESSYALGVPKYVTILRIVIPTAIAGITTGIMLSIARVMGETAPLLLTAGITNVLITEVFDGRIATLPVFAFESETASVSATDEFAQLAWAAALTLIFLVMILNVAARLISYYFAPKTGR